LRLKPGGGWKRLKEKLLNLLIFLSVVVILLSLGVIFVFYNPSVITGHLKKEVKRESSLQEGGIDLPEPQIEVEEEGVPPEVEERIKELAPVIDGYFVRLRCGVERRPALVLKAVPEGEKVRLYLLTLYPMEWPFTRLELQFGSFSPKRVYQCKGAVLLIEFELQGLFPPEVSLGEVDQYGALAVVEGSSVRVQPFKKGECTGNGFVFNLAGDFAGVCFGGEFVDGKELYGGAPSSCKIIYKSSGGKE